MKGKRRYQLYVEIEFCNGKSKTWYKVGKYRSVESALQAFNDLLPVIESTIEGQGTISRVCRIRDSWDNSVSFYGERIKG